MTDIENLPALPVKWCWTTLGEISKLNPKLQNAGISDDTEISFLPMKCVQEKTGIFDPSITKKYLEVKKGYTAFTNGDILFAKITPCMENGKVTVVDGLKNKLGFGSTEFHVIRVINKEIEKKFIFFYLVREEFRRDAKRNMTGSAGQLRVPTNYMQETKIPLPPLPEQHRIVQKIEELFTDLDAGVQALEKAKVQVKNYRRAVLSAAVEGKLVSIEAGLAEEKGKNSIQENSLPEGWTWTTIGQISESLDHLRIPINKKEREKRVGDIPYYGANGQVSWIDDYIFEEPLVLVVEDETFTGRQKPFSYKITGKSWVNNHAHVLRPTDNVDIDFLNYSLAYYPFTPLTTGTTGRKKLTKSALVSAPYKLPPLAEQHRIVSEIERRFSVIDQIEKTIDQSLIQAEKLRQSILKKAFEGKLVPQNLNDEPASVLLERIKEEKGRAESRKNPGKKTKLKAGTVMEISEKTKQAELF